MELHLLLISAVIAVVCTCPYLVSAANAARTGETMRL